MPSVCSWHLADELAELKVRSERGADIGNCTATDEWITNLPMYEQTDHRVHQD